MSTTHPYRTEILIGERPVPLIARVNRRAKRLILKVDPVAGEILVTAPSKRSTREAVAFARDQAKWIEGQLDENLRAQRFVENLPIPIRGKMRRIIREGGPRAAVQLRDVEGEHQIVVGGEAAHLNRRLVDWMKATARRDLTERVDYYSDKLGKKRRDLRIRDTRTRWGSCSSDGVLSFSWRLIMAPSEILDYVAAHECVHLEHMNHSPAFWRRVASLGVDARKAENWFATHGQTLFSYGVIQK